MSSLPSSSSSTTNTDDVRTSSQHTCFKRDADDDTIVSSSTNYGHRANKGVRGACASPLHALGPVAPISNDHRGLGRRSIAQRDRDGADDVSEVPLPDQCRDDAAGDALSVATVIPEAHHVACQQQQAASSTVAEEKTVLGWEIALAALAAANGCPTAASLIARRTAQSMMEKHEHQQDTLDGREKGTKSTSCSTTVTPKQHAGAGSGCSSTEGRRSRTPASSPKSAALKKTKKNSVERGEGARGCSSASNSSNAVAKTSTPTKTIPIVKAAQEKEEIAECSSQQRVAVASPPHAAVGPLQPPPSSPPAASSTGGDTGRAALPCATDSLPSRARCSGKRKRGLSEQAGPALSTPPPDDIAPIRTRSTSSTKQATPHHKQATTCTEAKTTAAGTISKNTVKPRQVRSSSNNDEMHKCTPLPSEPKPASPAAVSTKPRAAKPKSKQVVEPPPSQIPNGKAAPAEVEVTVERAVQKLLGLGNKDRELPGCEHEDCEMPASFGVKSDGRVVRCSRHYTGNMMDLLIRRCPMERCDRYPPKYGYPGQPGSSLVCEFHCRADMLDLGDSLCQRQGCTSRPSPAAAAVYRDRFDNVAKAYHLQRPSLFCDTHASDLVAKKPGPQDPHKHAPNVAGKPRRKPAKTKATKPKLSNKSTNGTKPKKSGTSGGPPAVPAAPPAQRRVLIRPPASSVQPPMVPAMALRKVELGAPPETCPTPASAFPTRQPQFSQPMRFRTSDEGLGDPWARYGVGGGSGAGGYVGYSGAYDRGGCENEDYGGEDAFERGRGYERGFGRGGVGGYGGHVGGGGSWIYADGGTEAQLPHFYSHVTPGQQVEHSPMFELPDISMGGRTMAAGTHGMGRAGLRRA